MHRSSQDHTPNCPAETFPDFTGKRLRSETIREVFAVNSSRNPLKYKHYSQCVFYLQFERGKVVGNVRNETASCISISPQDLTLKGAVETFEAIPLNSALNWGFSIESFASVDCNHLITLVSQTQCLFQ